MTSKQKAPALRHSTKIAIARYKKKYPTASLDEIAQKYNCTANQVRYALDQDKRGELRRSPGRTKYKDVEKVKSEKTADELLESQFQHAIAQLEADGKLAADMRIALLEKLFNMMKTLQATKLVGHLKRADALIIARIVKRYEPEATDQRVIEIYREELEKHRAAI
jgi:hypothetical protein